LLYVGDVSIIVSCNFARGYCVKVVELVRNLVVHGDAREGK